MLLGGAGVASVGLEALCGDPWKEEAGLRRGSVGSQIETASKARKAKAGDKGRDAVAGRYVGYKSAGKARAQPGAAKDRHTPLRGSTKEVVAGKIVSYPNEVCSDSPSGSHHYHDVAVMEGGNVWYCKYCHCYVWLPSQFEQLVRLGNNMKQLGTETAYNTWLWDRPAVRNLLQRLQTLQSLEHSMTTDQFVDATVAVLTGG